MDQTHLIPLYMQASNRICEEIKKQNFREGEILPRVNQLSRIMKMNAAATEKAMQYLVDIGILENGKPLEYRVTKGARETLIKASQEEFYRTKLPEFLKEANQLGISQEDIIHYLTREDA